MSVAGLRHVKSRERMAKHPLLSGGVWHGYKIASLRVYHACLKL